jgi:hypothetical protein
MFTGGRKQWLSKRRVDIVAVGVFKMMENVYLIASDASQVVPLSRNSKGLLFFILLTC